MKRKKLNKVDIYLIISILLLLIYTVVDRFILVVYGMSSDTLTTCFFGFFGTEIASCCIIKSLNIRNERFKMDGTETDPKPIDIEGGVG